MDIFQQKIELAAAKSEIREHLSVLEKYGLTLTEDDMEQLVDSRRDALHANGRVEFGGGILPKLIEAFVDSPFLNEENLVDTLSELQTLFYDFKSEYDETISDDELVEMMKDIFNGRAQGDLGYFMYSSFEELCHQARLNRL